ncbi:MAG: hypothetical protein WA979_12685 [Pacificimonas sp.]
MNMQLRITAGPMEGAERALSTGDRVFVGYDLRNDIVIREPSAKGIRLSLAEADDGVRAELISGTIMLHGAEIEAPRNFLLPPLTPIGIGDNIVAVGESGDIHWASCERLSQALALQAPAGEPTIDPWSGLNGWLRVGYRDIAKRSALFMMGFAVLLGGTAMATADGIKLGSINHHQRLATALKNNGFSALEVRDNIEGELVVDGFVSSDAQLSRVADVIEATGAPAMTQVESGETVAREVENVLRINGVNATAVYRGSGKVEAMGFEAPRDIMQKLRRAVMDDVPAVEQLVLTPKKLTDGEGTVMAHDPGKRVATVVGGPRGYIITDDGARYFAGASLPTGDHLVSVSADAMVLERNGLKRTVRF